MRGRISSLGTPRTEVVETRWDDALTRLAVLLVVIAVAVLLFAAYWPMLIMLGVVLLLVGGLGKMVGFSLFMLMRGGGRGKKEPRELEIPVTPFTITRADGSLLEAALRGELAGGSLHIGDIVQLSGRTARDGTVHCTEVRNETTGARTRPRAHPAIARSRAKMVVSVATIVLVLVLMYPYYAPLLR